MDQMHFTFSDLISGYVTEFEWEKKDFFKMETSDGRVFEVKISDNCYAELTRNLGDAFIDASGNLRDMLAPGRYLFAYGIFFNDGGTWNFEAKHIVFAGRTEKDFSFEQPKWWVKQIQQLGEFYLRAQFPSGDIDYKTYHTQLSLSGSALNATSYRQETDTISRLVYGFASAYNLTGDERFLEAAEKGTAYLRDHFRCMDAGDDACFWYHAIDLDLKTGHERKILASEFGDDFDAIPAYEQIYALAGPTQTLRVTGDPRIVQDIQWTINMFERYYLDPVKGGYWSHIDPVTFDGQAESLGRNRARKNWNSVGDHTPAYLINAVIATGNEEWAKMLEYCADCITEHFQDYDNSPFINEKFHADWSHDQTWGWQQNRGVVGHNLKIAWNLTRVFSLIPKDSYTEFSKRIAKEMPEWGMDKQRGGWYDVVDRVRADGQDFHRYAWHDRKAWWQQEQGILAYQIMAGVYKQPEYTKYARESIAFYNAWFLDHDSGGVYFNVLANGMPFLLGTERQKGSHSMSGYHSFELCFLAAVYNNLLLAKQPLDLYFKPIPGALPGNILRVAPDLLPKGSIRIGSVLVDGKPHADFDAEALTVTLPATDDRVTVKVVIEPTSGLDHFESSITCAGEEATITAKGDLDGRAVPHFRADLEKAYGAKKVVVDLTGTEHMSKEAARALLFAKQKMGVDVDMVIKGANEQVKSLLEAYEFPEEVSFA